VEIGRGGTVGQACKKIGVTEHTSYPWRAEHGGLKLDQAKRMKALEMENARLNRVVADQALDIAILKAGASGNF
jgi:hypothetical protein